MSSVSLFSAAGTTFSLQTNTFIPNNKPCPLRVPRLPVSLSHHSRSSPSPLTHTFNPLRSLIGHDGRIVQSRRRRSRGFSAVSYAAPFTANNLQWISTVSSV